MRSFSKRISIKSYIQQTALNKQCCYCQWWWWWWWWVTLPVSGSKDLSSSLESERLWSWLLDFILFSYFSPNRRAGAAGSEPTRFIHVFTPADMSVCARCSKRKKYIYQQGRKTVRAKLSAVPSFPKTGACFLPPTLIHGSDGFCGGFRFKCHFPGSWRTRTGTVLSPSRWCASHLLGRRKGGGRTASQRSGEISSSLGDAGRRRVRVFLLLIFLLTLKKETVRSCSVLSFLNCKLWFLLWVFSVDFFKIFFL